MIEELADGVPREILDHASYRKYYEDDSHKGYGPRRTGFDELKEHGLQTLFNAVGKTGATLSAFFTTIPCIVQPAGACNKDRQIDVARQVGS
ncbi:hypothetical protein [Streptomyces sp. NPDC058280]|uniref:hypothetical protein n=1 Tax=Streptomyces sp. NPDC058280 TaxID=3346419 RepID=UPI0036EBBAB4